ncbi:hypothetical protein [Salibacterium halotolerans]|uniref:hypothetical protein n=1 Tax=Salibacterium halotolerans TaxID=1884432 RepID=UPI001114113D|nr:hypothetical protein [Salibacterium halotolerans]
MRVSMPKAQSPQSLFQKKGLYQKVQLLFNNIENSPQAETEGGDASGKSSGRRSHQTAVLPFDVAEALPAASVRLQWMP